MLRTGTWSGSLCGLGQWDKAKRILSRRLRNLSTDEVKWLYTRLHGRLMALPLVLLGNILSFFAEIGERDCMRRVCKRFPHALNQPGAWTHVDLRRVTKHDTHERGRHRLLSLSPPRLMTHLYMRHPKLIPFELPHLHYMSSVQARYVTPPELNALVAQTKRLAVEVNAPEWSLPDLDSLEEFSAEMRGVCLNTIPWDRSSSPCLRVLRLCVYSILHTGSFDLPPTLERFEFQCLWLEDGGLLSCRFNAQNLLQLFFPTPHPRLETLELHRLDVTEDVELSHALPRLRHVRLSYDHEFDGAHMATIGLDASQCAKPCVWLRHLNNRDAMGPRVDKLWLTLAPEVVVPPRLLLAPSRQLVALPKPQRTTCALLFPPGRFYELKIHIPGYETFCAPVVTHLEAPHPPLVNVPTVHGQSLRVLDIALDLAFYFRSSCHTWSILRSCPVLQVLTIQLKGDHYEEYIHEVSRLVRGLGRALAAGALATLDTFKLFLRPNHCFHPLLSNPLQPCRSPPLDLASSFRLFRPTCFLHIQGTSDFRPEGGPCVCVASP